MMGSYAKDLRLLAGRYGFTVDNSKGGHYVLTRPDVHGKVFASVTPKSVKHALLNIEGDLRRLLKTTGHAV
jgi:hypothetical protein